MLQGIGFQCAGSPTALGAKIGRVLWVVIITLSQDQFVFSVVDELASLATEIYTLYIMEHTYMVKYFGVGQCSLVKFGQCSLANV